MLRSYNLHYKSLETIALNRAVTLQSFVDLLAIGQPVFSIAEIESLTSSITFRSSIFSWHLSF